ncbi:MAG TPA: hypothetical protein DD727_02575, partial [Clostridiales bacterium]|nr:hypothetical protein [Clostridiales bacterium]
MRESIVLSATAVSVKGISNLENEGNFFLNGKSMAEIDMDSVRVTTDTQGSQFIYAICGNLGHRTNRKAAASMMISELRNLQGKMTDSFMPADRRAIQLKESFENTQNAVNRMTVVKDAIEPDRTLFSSLAVYNDTAAVYTTGLGCVLLARDGELNELDPMRSFSLKQGDTFLLCSYNVIKTVGADRLCDLMLAGTDTGLVAEALTADLTAHGIKTDILLLVVRISRINETEILRMESVTEDRDEVELHNNEGFSEKISKFYDKRQETLRTIVAAILTCVVAAA